MLRLPLLAPLFDLRHIKQPQSTTVHQQRGIGENQGSWVTEGEIPIATRATAAGHRQVYVTAHSMPQAISAKHWICGNMAYPLCLTGTAQL